MPDEPLSPDAAAKPVGIGSAASVGIFMALLAGLFVFARSSTALLRYPDRAIGFGLLQGVDPARRFSIYLTIVAVVAGVWLAFHFGAQQLRRRQPGWFVGVRSRLENDLCALLAAVGSVSVVARISADRLDRLASALVCLSGIGVVVAFALARRYSARLGWSPRPLGSLNMLALAALLAWPAPKVLGVLTNVQGADSAWAVVVGVLLLPPLFVLALAWCLRRPGRATRDEVYRAFAFGVAPLFAFPSLCAVANEVQHALAQHDGTLAPRTVALSLLVLLVALGAFLFWRAHTGKLRLSPGRLLTRYVYPTIIFGQALLGNYSHELASRHVDTLHDGEQITAVHQLLEYGKLPFVDIWPAHGLFDYLGALYSLVNGFQPLEISAWNGLLAALSACAVYAVLANVGAPLFAFLVAALLPIEVILPLPAYSYFYAEPGLLAVGLFACVALARPTLWRYALLALATFLCFFWTPTSGVASIAAVLGLVVHGWVTARDRRPITRGLVVFIGVGALVFLTYVLVLVLRGQPVFDTLGQIRAYMQADPLVGGRPVIIGAFDAPAFVQYVLLPGIGVVYLVRLAQSALERRPLDHAERVLGFLTFVSLVLFARTLTRHGILERYQPFFFVFLALCAWLPRRSRALLAEPAGNGSEGPSRLAAHFWQRAGARAWFCLGFALYLVWMPQPAYRELGLETFEFHTWKPGEKRFKGATPTYPKLSAFLGATLGPNETFLELLNTPALYGLLDREVPGELFLVTMFYASDTVQKSYLKRLEAFGGSARVPVVLLPGEEGRNIDNIENTLRSYRIAEHVYREYVPFGTMDGFQVWVSRARWDEARTSAQPRPLSFRDPGKYKVSSMAPPRLEGDVLHLTANGPDPRVEGVAEVDGLGFGAFGSYHAIRLSYRTSVPGTLELFYRFGKKYRGADSGRAAIAPSPAGEWQTVEVPIPFQSNPKAPLAGLRIDPPVGADLELKDPVLVFGQPSAFGPERSPAGMLPFFMGSFDQHRALEVAPVLQTLDVPGGKKPLSSFELALGPIEDKRAGNYLQLCIRLPGLPVERTTRRWKNVNHADSWQSAGRVTLTYGTTPSATFLFDLVQPMPGVLGLPDALARSFAEECKPYLARLSSQYVWNSQAISSIKVTSSVPIVLENASVLGGD